MDKNMHKKLFKIMKNKYTELLFRLIILILFIVNLFAIISFFGVFQRNEVISEFSQYMGYAYTYYVNKSPFLNFLINSDGLKNNTKSKLILYEDKKHLGPPHSLHSDLREKGMGRYSHWDSNIFFTTSDNSNPNSNNRIYSIHYPLIFPVKIFGMTMIALVLMIAAHVAAYLKVVNFIKSMAICIKIYRKSNNLPLKYFILASIVFGFVLPLILFFVSSIEPEIKTITLEKNTINNEIGHAYTINYSTINFDITKAQLFEDGKLIGHGNAAHKKISEEGGGLYSFWYGTLYFSTSDNTNPGTNERVYTISEPIIQWYKSSKFLFYFILFQGLILIFIANHLAKYSRSIYLFLGGWIAFLILASHIFIGPTMPISGGLHKSDLYGDTLWNSSFFSPDSQSYMVNSVTRTIGYPLFISSVIDRNDYAKSINCSTLLPKNHTEHPFIPITHAQIIIFILSVFFLGILLTHFISIWSSFFLGLALYVYGSQPIFYLAYVMTEGVLISLIILILGVVVWVIKKPSVVSSLILGTLFIAAFLVTPRAIGYFPVLLAPAAGRLINSRKIMSIFSPASWLAPVIALTVYGGICSYNKYNYDAFSIVPYNGYSSIPIALAIADIDDYKHFEDPIIREYVKTCLDSVAVSPYKWTNSNFANYNVFRVAEPICVKMFQGDSNYYKGKKASLTTVCNSIMAKVSGVLISHNYSKLFCHSFYYHKLIDKYLPIGGHIFWFLISLILLIQTIIIKNPTAMIGLLIIITHYSSMILTLTFMGIVWRYTDTTQWMLPFALILCIVEVVKCIILRIKS